MRILFSFEETTNGFVKYENNKKYFRDVYCDAASIINMLSFLKSICESILKKNREKTNFVKINK